MALTPHFSFLTPNLVGSGGLRRAGLDRAGDAAVGAGRARDAPRREPARALLVEPVQRLGVHPQPDDARAVPIRGERCVVPGVRRQRRDCAAAVRDHGDRADRHAAVVQEQAGASRRARGLGAHLRVSGDTVLQPVRAQRHTDGSVDARPGDVHVEIPGRGSGALPVHQRRTARAGVRHQGVGVPGGGNSWAVVRGCRREE